MLSVTIMSHLINSSLVPPASRCSAKPQEYIAAGRTWELGETYIYLVLWRPGKGATDSAWREKKVASGGGGSSRKMSPSGRWEGVARGKE